jgi:hypothetical protein
MSQESGARFTEKQGHYLAFIHTYSYLFGRPPAEADIQRHFPRQPADCPPDARHPRTERLHPTTTRRPQKHRDSPASGKLAHPPVARYQTINISVMNRYRLARLRDNPIKKGQGTVVVVRLQGIPEGRRKAAVF